MNDKPEQPIAGRPPIENPYDKMSQSARTMITPRVRNAMLEAMKTHGIPAPSRGAVSSYLVRLYLYNGLRADGLMTPDLDNDPSFKELKDWGLI